MSAPTVTDGSASAVETAGPADRAASTPSDDLATFDVFETVLVRTVSPPQAVFDVLGRRAAERGWVTCSPQAFGRARMAAEQRALRWFGDSTSLERIHAQLAATLLLPTELVPQLAQAEMDVEAELLRPVPAMRAVLQQERLRSGRVVYVSDMYLPASFIEDQLRRHGLWQPGDVLYVSHAHGRTKRTGRLYDVVARAECVPVGRLRHNGNSRPADVVGAQRAGAQAVLLSAGNPTRYEEVLGRHRQATDGLTASMAGASRLARLDRTVTGDRETALVEVAAGVMAPVLTAHVTWLLRRAQALGLRRLYFVARDGQVLLRIAERLAPALGVEVELRYLYASRVVWNRVVSGPRRNPTVWRSLVELSSQGVSNRDILERTGLDAAAVDRVVSASREPARAWGSTTDRRPLAAALRQVDEDGTLAAAAEQGKRVLLRYLQEQGLLDGTPHGFVDVGWRGTQHDVLLELQQEQGTTLAHGLFFGLEDSEGPWGDRREAFYFDSRGFRSDEQALQQPFGTLGDPAYFSDSLRPQGSRLSLSQFALIEVFCAGDHGTLAGYQETDDGVQPVLSQGKETQLRRWGLPLVRATLDSYVEHLAADSHLRNNHVDVHPALTELMRLFWERPTRAEVDAWAGFPWEVGQGPRGRVLPLVAPTRLRHLAGATPFSSGARGAVERARRTEWLAASLTLSSPQARLLLWPRPAVADLVRRARDRARRVRHRLGPGLRSLGTRRS